MAAPPNNDIIRRFVVEVTIDRDNPKAPTVEQLELRIGDGVQWMDGVMRVTTKHDIPRIVTCASPDFSGNTCRNCGDGSEAH